MKTSSKKLAIASSCLLGLAAAGPDMVIGRAPEATPAPANVLVERALRQRALTADGEQTCGFVTGDADSPLTCDPGYNCAYNSINEVGGCCDLDLPLSDCTLQTGCYDYTAWLLMTTTMNDYEGACENPWFPSCMGYVSSTYTFLACGTARTLVPVEDVATFSGGGDIFSVTSGTGSPTFTVPRTTASVAGGGASGIGADAAGATGPSGNVANVAGSALPTATTTVISPASSGSSSSSSGSKLSTSAIVGIAVAAAAVAIVALCALGFCFWNKSRQQRRLQEEARLSAAMGGAGTGYGGHSTLVPSTVGGQTLLPPPSRVQSPQLNQQQQMQQQPFGVQQHTQPVMAVTHDNLHPGNAGAGYYNQAQEWKDNHVTVVDDASEIGPNDAVDERFRPGRVMSDDGTASVIPNYPHHPPHIG